MQEGLFGALLVPVGARSVATCAIAARMRHALLVLALIVAGCPQPQDENDTPDLLAAEATSPDLANAANACSKNDDCDAPPTTTCLTDLTRRAFAATGRCSTKGQCTYKPTDTVCPGLCEDGECVEDALCVGESCDSPPPADCASASTRVEYDAQGSCKKGICSYPSHAFACDGAPANACLGSTLTTYPPIGACAGGVCSYPPTTGQCSDPPPPSCSNSTLTTYAATGSCAANQCAYATSTMSCAYGCNMNACRDQAMRLFVTRGVYAGELDQGQAKAKCESAAAAAGLSGSWAPWLAYPTQAPVFADVGPWYATDGTTLLFSNRAQLGGFPSAPIALDELGEAVPSGSEVWTGLTVSFGVTDHDCAHWGLDSHYWYGTFGTTHTTAQAWTDAGFGYCDVKRHLYCIEQ